MRHRIGRTHLLEEQDGNGNALDIGGNGDRSPRARGICEDDGDPM